MRRNVQPTADKNKTPSEKRTISAVMKSPELVEAIIVEGFKRGFASKSAAAAKIIELGFEEFKKLPVLKGRETV
jgi:hypothetical protein